MPILEALGRELTTIHAPGAPLLTVSLDLRAPALGWAPAGPNAVRQALNEEATRLGLSSQAELRSFKEDLARLDSAIEEATAEGAQGLFFVGCSGEDVAYDVALPSPFRNSARIGERSWLFELERARYLFGQPFTVVFVEMHNISMARVRYGEEAETAGVDYNKHWLSKKAGRTNIEGRSGSVAAGAMGAGSGPMGGHSKNRVNQIVEEHRREFAREAAAELEAFIGDAERFLLAGVPEARSQLLAQLDRGLAGRVLEVAAAPVGADPAGLANAVLVLSSNQQRDDADAAAREWLSGAVGERLAAGRTAVLASLAEGRLAELVVHEESVRHLGTAEDTRAQGPDDDEPIGEILRLAKETDVALRFGREPILLDDYEGVVGMSRW